MTIAPDQLTDLETLSAVIARSQIVVAPASPRVTARPALPDGFEEADIAILEWIAAERGGAGCRLLRM